MLSRALISEYPGYSLISEPITAHEKHYSLVEYMLTVGKVNIHHWLTTNTEGDYTVLVFAQSVNRYGEFQY